MFNTIASRLKTCASLMALTAASGLVFAGAAHAQSASDQASDSLAVNIVHALVKQGVLTQDKADAILSEAQAETDQARAAHASDTQASAAQAMASAPANDGVVRVPYIPENVRAEIKNELKTEMVAQAKTENWATPNTFPDWVSHVSLFGDFRFRNETRTFDHGNATDIVNFNAINQGSAYNANGVANPPILNSTQNRDLMQIRARFGVKAQITDNVLAVVSAASGNDNGPTSTTQTLGADFNKPSLWLDLAYLSYKPIEDLELVFGRAPNPFTSTEIVWKQDDLRFDGVSARYDYGFDHSGRANLHGTLGVFPLDYTDGYESTALSSGKPSDHHDKYLIGGQFGGSYRFTQKLTGRLDAAYYDFVGTRGVLSDPCLNTSDYCDTDYTRPAYMQKGNTLFAVRNLTTADPSNTAIPQYFGLASNYRVLDLVGKLDYTASPNFIASLTMDYAKNLAFDKAKILAMNPVTNIGCSVNITVMGATCSGSGGKTTLQSGDDAWLVRATIGHPAINMPGDWKASLAYAHIEPDAVIDAFDDKDFRMGGTNSKGFILQGDYGIAKNTWITGKYLSADAIHGAPYTVDVFQLDLNTRF